MDFNAYMACCSANYQRLRKMLNRQIIVGEYITWPVGKMGKLSIHLAQKHPFTELYRIKYQDGHPLEWLMNFDMELRLYHDAQLAEVIGYQDTAGKMQYFSESSIPYQFAYWEKWQMNHLLADALSSIIKHQKSASS